MKHIEIIMTKGKYIFVIVLIMFALPVLCKHLTNPWLWYDEAGQFWISKGLNHFTLPYSVPQDLWHVIVNNRFCNMDPGGFSVLLHYWLKLSNHFFIIRLFPLLFFIGFACLFFHYLRGLTGNLFFSLFCASLLFLWPVTVSRMVEVRAYSMEMMGIVWTLILLDKCRKTNYSVNSLLLLSTCMSIFCTSRYDFVVFAFVIGLYTLIKIIKTKVFLLKKTMAFSVPLFVSVEAIFLITLQYQNPSLEKMNYLLYLSDIPSLTSLFHQRLFLLYVLNTVVVLVSFCKKRTMRQLQIISLMVSTMIIILSLMGKSPWDKIRTISVVIVLILNLTNEIYHNINLKNSSYLGDYIRIPLVILIWYFLIGTIFIPKVNYDEYESLKYSINQEKPKVLYMGNRFSPSVRYIYEYGILKERAGRDHYPESFLFQYSFDEQAVHIQSRMPDQVEADLYLINGATIFKYVADSVQYKFKCIQWYVYTKTDQP